MNNTRMRLSVLQGSDLSARMQWRRNTQGNCSYNTELGGETYFMKNGTSTVLVKTYHRVVRIRYWLWLRVVIR